MSFSPEVLQAGAVKGLILNAPSAVQMVGEKNSMAECDTGQQCDNYEAWLDGGRHEYRHFNSKRPNRHESDGETIWQSGTRQQRDMKRGWIRVDMKTRHFNTERPNSHDSDGETIWQSGTGQQRDKSRLVW